MKLKITVDDTTFEHDVESVRGMGLGQSAIDALADALAGHRVHPSKKIARRISTWLTNRKRGDSEDVTFVEAAISVRVAIAPHLTGGGQPVVVSRTLPPSVWGGFESLAEAQAFADKHPQKTELRLWVTLTEHTPGKGCLKNDWCLRRDGHDGACDDYHVCDCRY